MLIDTPALEPIQALYDRALFTQAYRAAEGLGPLGSWRGAEARILAGRIAHQLGDSRLGVALHDLAYREHPDHPKAIYFAAFERVAKRGSFAAWMWMRGRGDLEGAPPGVQSDWFSLRAVIAAVHRDFERAHRWLDRAIELTPDRAWTWAERSRVLELEDRCEDSLAAAARGCELRSPSLGCLSRSAHVLQLLGRDEEALGLLEGALDSIESHYLYSQLSQLQLELGRHEDAWRSLERARTLAVLADRNARKELAALRAEIAYQRGDFAEARRAGQASKQPFHERVAERLAGETAGARRVQLPVAFVRQHHMTCAPATLTAISRFWSRPAEHLEVAEEICYDGTFGHAERSWATDHGWHVREFRVTWESTVALIDARIPFAMTTVDQQSAHLQAVIGYDTLRRTLLVRDPSLRVVSDFLADEFFGENRYNGPRGMAMVPSEEAGRLDALDLPDAAAFDHYHRVQRALLAHDRDAAVQAADALEAVDADHPLALQARMSLADYDSDPVARLSRLERAAALFPGDARIKLAQLPGLRAMGRREDRLRLLKELHAGKEPGPVVLQQYAQELGEDARHRVRAGFLLRRSLRMDGSNGGTLYILGNLLWSARRFEEALEAYRFATSLADKDEAFADAWFRACLHFRRGDQAVAFLKDRYRRFGAQSSLPARTLFAAYETLDRDQEGFALLDDAIERRPNDGELMLYAADCHAAWARLEKAEEYLARAEARSARLAWRRTAAKIALQAGDREAACNHYEGVLRHEPLSIESHRGLAQILAETRGREAALDHLAAATERFPDNMRLLQAHLDWVAPGDEAAREQLLRRMQQTNPANAWVQRELALCLGAMRRLEEAAAALEAAATLDPAAPELRNVRGRLHLLNGRVEEAREELRESIRLDADQGFAISRLVEHAGGIEEKREALGFVLEQLGAQPVHGRGIVAWRGAARGVLEPEAILEELRRFKEVREDLWEAWSVLIDEAASMDRLDEAAELASQAVERFPLLPRLRTDQARVHGLAGNREAEIAALEACLAVAPGYDPAIRHLADAHQMGGDLERSVALLEKAAERDPFDSMTHGYLADALWKAGERRRALDHIAKAAELDPDYGWAWSRLDTWGDRLGHPERVVQVAREVTRKRGGEVVPWLNLAQSLAGHETLDERLAAVDRAIALDPLSPRAHDTKSTILAGARRFDEAIQACRAGPWGDRPPAILVAQEAWIIAEQRDLRGAIRRMREALEAEPLLAWGWRRLVEWHAAIGENPERLEAAERLVAIEPNEPLALVARAEARKEAGDHEGARRDFERALAIDPENITAAQRLVAIELDAGRQDEARVVFARVAPLLEPHRRELLGLGIAADTQDSDEALTRLAALCQGPLPADRTLAIALDVCRANTWLGRAIEVMIDVVRERVRARGEGKGGGGPELGVTAQVFAAAVERAISMGRLGNVEGWLEEWRTEPKLLHAGANAVLEASRDHGERHAAFFDEFMRRNREVLRSDAELWGTAGYSLLCRARPADTAQWLSDWPDREGVRPWMLYNLVLAHLALDEFATALEVARRGAELPPDHTTEDHLALLLFEAGMAGLGDEVAARRGEFQHDGVGAPYRAMMHLADAALAAYDGRAGFAAARQHVIAAADAHSNWTDDPLVRGCYLRALTHVAARCGGVWPRIWAFGSKRRRRPL